MPSLHLVDAFTALPFAGNPAAVCLLDGPAEAAWMQKVAFELGYSETAFVHEHADGWALRWFTPTVEVALCGHATLATAHTLWGTARAQGRICFQTKSGELRCDQDGELIRMDFPRTHLTAEEAPPGLLAALGTTAVSVWRAKWDYLVEVADEAMLKSLQPDHRALRTVSVRGVAVTARSSDPTYDFVSRFFAPGSGIDEDPVTGSAHCALTPFWAERLGKTRMRAYQASPRGGVVDVELAGERVLLGGQAVTVLRGELLV